MRILDRPDRCFVLASLVCGLGFAILTPPFQVPDEPAHFYRSYLVSEGRLGVVPHAGVAELPDAVPRLARELLGSAPFDVEVKIDPHRIVDAFSTPLEPAERSSVSFPSSLQYTFLPYLPQALGIAAGRAAGAPALALLYAARLANLAAGTLALWAAIRMLPALRWSTLLLAMMPMALALRASASADTTAIGAAFLLAAAFARIAWGKDPPARRHFVLLAVSAAVLCASKPPYLPLALLALLIPVARWPPLRRAAWLSFMAGVVGVLVAWSMATARAVGVVRPDAPVDPARQLAGIVADPFGLLRIVVADYIEHTPRYLAQFVGHLGWLDTKPPAWFLIAYLLMLVSVTLLDGEGAVVLAWQRAGLLAVVVACLLLVSASQYATFTPFGARHVEGLQGRYYIPVAAAGMWVLHLRRPDLGISPRALGASAMAAVVIGYGIVVRTLLDRFYGF